MVDGLDAGVVDSLGRTEEAAVGLIGSTRRASPGGWVYRPLPKGQNGRSLCRRCSAEVPTRRRTFCSKACVHEWKLRTDPGYLRQQVFLRDRGVCAACGLDTMATGRVPLRRQAPPHHQRARGSGHLWQADHIVPVTEGGGECGLENIRTLCTACHKRETAALRARLAGKISLAPLLCGDEQMVLWA